MSMLGFLELFILELWQPQANDTDRRADRQTTLNGLVMGGIVI